MRPSAPCMRLSGACSTLCTALTCEKLSSGRLGADSRAGIATRSACASTSCPSSLRRGGFRAGSVLGKGLPRPLQGEERTLSLHVFRYGCRQSGLQDKDGFNCRPEHFMLPIVVFTDVAAREFRA